MWRRLDKLNIINKVKKRREMSNSRKRSGKGVEIKKQKNKMENGKNNKIEKRRIRENRPQSMMKKKKMHGKRE